MPTKNNHTRCTLCEHAGCCDSCGMFGGGMLESFDYLEDLPAVPKNSNDEEWVEVHFKNTRKGFFVNSLHLSLKKGDLVTVEASPGQDIGTVCTVGKMVELRMRKTGYNPAKNPRLKVFRIAKTNDLERFEEVRGREQETMIRTREITKELGLDMKISDVEFQGDGQKAIFYYIADQRVDFRQLIKRLAETFHIRVEMRQIGVRQEAGRIGGIGPCGRQLCCSSWMTKFMSVSTGAAKIQDLTINQQKLAGQCAKLKCCLNYEVDLYIEAQGKLPAREITLKTSRAEYRLIKTDALAQLVTYAEIGMKREEASVITISAERAHRITQLNTAAETPFDLLHDEEPAEPAKEGKPSKDILSGESLTRFDSQEKGVRRDGKSTGKKRKNKNKKGPATDANSGNGPKQ